MTPLDWPTFALLPLGLMACFVVAYWLENRLKPPESSRPPIFPGWRRARHGVCALYVGHDSMVKKFVQRPDEIRRNSDGTIDEVVVHDCLFHLEQMDDGAWWIGLSRGNRTLHLWIQTEKQDRMRVTVTDDELGCHDHVTDQAAD